MVDINDARSITYYSKLDMLKASFMCSKRADKTLIKDSCFHNKNKTAKTKNVLNIFAEILRKSIDDLKSIN